MASQRWLPLALIAVFGLTACPPPAERPADETATPAPEVTAEPMMQQQIAVTNTTMEPITVTATVEGRQQELGRVQPNGSATFMVTAPRGERVEVEARGPAGEVVERQTINVSETRYDWRLTPRTGEGTAPGTTTPGAAPGQP